MINFSFRFREYVITIKYIFLLRAGFYNIRYWRWDRWEIVPFDPWNGFDWGVYMPFGYIRRKTK